MSRRTKKAIKEYAIGLLGLAVMLGGFCFASYIENHYTMTCKVAEYGNKVCFIDEMGEAWEDDRVNEYSIGDEVVVVFDTNTTDNTRHDDKVFKIK